MKRKAAVTIRATDGTSLISPEELEHWGEMLGLHQLAPDRFSSVLVMELLNLMRQGIPPSAVLDEIRALEAGRSTATKPATAFKNPTLARANIWHKHFFTSTMNMMATNIEMELKGEAGIGKTVTDILGSLSDPPTEQDFSRLSHALFVEPFFNRFNRSAMTGEWLIYSPRSSGNLYLGACPHSTGDEGLIKRLEIWRIEFPGLVPEAGAGQP